MNRFTVSLTFLFISYILSAQPVSEYIKVDQFGYLPDMPKVAVLSDPQSGYNAASSYTISATYELRRASDDISVFSGSSANWNGGATHTQSGDKVAWFDFSSYTTPGTYYVYDPTNNVRSYEFEISDCVYNEILKQAVRSYYYQRCGTAKASPYAQTGWTDAACHLGSEQDTDCRLYNNTSPSTSKDLSGGWHDAGDYNKYVNFVWGALIDLLLAYEENPTVWTDDYDIPESGNGIPDLLDEVKYELDWLLKMQQSDGSVLCVVGGGGASPPSADTDVRRYGPATTSASLTAAGVFALAAIQYEAAGMTAYAATLETAAIDAWNWADANPNVMFINKDYGLAAGEQELGNTQDLALRKLCASAFLYVLTGDAAYKTYFESNYDVDPPGGDDGFWYIWWYTYAYEWDIQTAMLYYTKAPGASGTVVSNIKSRFTTGINNNDNYNGIVNETDAYRAHMPDNNYNWGSNGIKCHHALMFQDMITYNMNSGTHTGYKNASKEFIHYIHGVNPTGFCYLTNMSAFGAENSVNEFYHSWFFDGSALWDRVGTSTYGPAPGFLVGGPNKNYKLDNCCSSTCNWHSGCSANVTPPLSQPPQKSYKDWNTSWPENSWQVTENSDGYQSAYIRLLSKFCSSSSCGTTTGLISQKNSHELIAVFPNPNSGEFQAEVNFSEKGEAQVEIRNSLGEIVYRKTEKDSPHAHFSFDLKDQPAGVYYLIIQKGDERKTGKFVKH